MIGIIRRWRINRRIRSLKKMNAAVSTSGQGISPSPAYSVCSLPRLSWRPSLSGGLGVDYPLRPAHTNPAAVSEALFHLSKDTMHNPSSSFAGHCCACGERREQKGDQAEIEV